MQFSNLVNILWILTLFFQPIDNAEIEDEMNLDPFDMINFDPINMKMKVPANKKVGLSGSDKEKEIEDSANEVQNVPKNQEKGETADEILQIVNIRDQNRDLDAKREAVPSGKPATPGPALSLFQQLVSRILLLTKEKVSKEQDGQSSELCLRIAMSAHDLAVLEHFKRELTTARAFDAHTVLTQTLKGAHLLREDDSILRIVWLEERLGVSVEKVLKVISVCILVMVLLLLMSKLHLTRKLIIWILFLTFVASTVMTWYRLYKGEMAKTHNAMMRDLPAGCQQLQDQGGPLENVVNFYRHYFTFQQDACEEFYEHLLVDPIVKVSPMEALAVAVVQTVLKPLRTVGTEISGFLRALVKDLPVQWQMVAVLLVAVFTFLVLFLACGYRVRIPFLLAIEPSDRKDNSEDVKALMMEIRELRALSEKQSHTSAVPAVISQSSLPPTRVQDIHARSTPTNKNENAVVSKEENCSASLPSVKNIQEHRAENRNIPYASVLSSGDASSKLDFTDKNEATNAVSRSEMPEDQVNNTTVKRLSEAIKEVPVIDRKETESTSKAEHCEVQAVGSVDTQQLM